MGARVEQSTTSKGGWNNIGQWLWRYMYVVVVYSPPPLLLVGEMYDRLVDWPNGSEWDGREMNKNRKSAH